MQRFLEADRPLVENSTRTILREAHTQGLISEIELWFRFQKFRNMTLHIYNQEVAKEIYENIKLFPSYCERLIQNLEQKKSQ